MKTETTRGGEGESELEEQYRAKNGCAEDGPQRQRQRRREYRRSSQGVNQESVSWSRISDEFGFIPQYGRVRRD